MLSSFEGLQIIMEQLSNYLMEPFLCFIWCFCNNLYVKVCRIV